MARLLQVVSALLLVAALAIAAPQAPKPDAAPKPSAPAAAGAAPEEQGTAQVGLPQIDWGLCQNLQPKPEERESKQLVIQKCLGDIPIPEGNITAKQADTHREEITTCALKAEGWFNADGSYKFDKARQEIKSKKLSKEIEASILQQHDACHKESLEKFEKEIVQQVQLYQACMDYHIARICRIQVVAPEGSEASPDYYQ